jgi:pyruvate-formate lyase
MYLWAYNSPNPDYEAVLRDGLNGRIKKVEATHPDQLDWIEKINEWKAMIIADKAVIAWARRFSRLAKIMAENFEQDSRRKEELLKISDNCHKCPAEPAEHLWEALQTQWFFYNLS